MYLLSRVGDLKKQPPCLLQEGCFEQVKYSARKNRYSLTNLFQLTFFGEFHEEIFGCLYGSVNDGGGFGCSSEGCTFRWYRI